MALVERGVCSGSDLYFQTPSENARQMLYYLTSCGSFLPTMITGSSARIIIIT